MNRAGKKAWLRELKRRQKAARGAGSESAALATAPAEDGPRPGTADENALGTVPAVGDCPRPGTAVEDAAPVEPSKTGTVPRSGDSPLVSEVVIAEAELQAARGYVADARSAGSGQARGLSDDEAQAMLVEAARLLHSVVRNANRVLDSLPPQRVLEAVCEPASSAAQGSPQSRPRRGSDPVFTLMRLGKEAASLLKRVLAKTNPGLGKAMKVA